MHYVSGLKHSSTYEDNDPLYSGDYNSTEIIILSHDLVGNPIHFLNELMLEWLDI